MSTPRLERARDCKACGTRIVGLNIGNRQWCTGCRPQRERTATDMAISKERKRVARLKRGMQARRPKIDSTGKVWCSTCTEYLPASRFYHKAGTSRTPHGYSAYCRSCSTRINRRNTLLSQYGLTLEQYELILAHQGGRCAICQARPRTSRLSVDHDHKSGVIRGLLCTRCNHRLLGGAHDNVNILRRAVRYLEEPPASFALMAEIGESA